MHETLSFFSGLILGSLLTLLLKPILLRASRRRAGRSELDTPLLPVASPAENATSAVASGTPAAYRPPKTALPTRSVVAAGGTLADETAETDQLLETVEGGGSLENAISVTVDNCSDQLATLVRVVVSDRTGLLAEMSAVLSGLGLSVLSATVSTDEATGSAANSFLVVEHGRKVVGRSRLAAIEQRMHDWARSGWLRQGIQRLIDRDAAATGSSRSIGSANSISALADGALEPPEPLRDAVRDAAPPEGPEEEEEPLLRAALCAALRCGALPFGSLPPGLAGDLAAAALPRMRRCRLPAGAELRSDSAWLLLLEDEATASVERAAATAPSSTQLRRATRSTAAWGEGGGGGGGCVAEEGGEPLSVPLPALSVLWEVALPPDLAPSQTAAASPPPRWRTVIAANGARLLALPASELRRLLVSRREALARRHLQLLSDLPVLAPLSPRRMLALCRRAVEVVLPPLTVALPPRCRGASFPAEAAEVLHETSFCILLEGELLVTLDLHEADGGVDGGADGGVDESAAAVPLRLPLHRLRARDTLGEAGALHGSALPRGVRISSCGAGARLLCWPRDSSLGEALSRLPELLPAGWSSRAELGCLAQAPGLGRKLLRSGALRPLGADLSALSATRDGRSTPLLCLVACGTLLETLPVSVTISPLSQRGGGGSSFEVGVRVPSRHRLLADLSSILQDLGLAVLSARIRTETGADGSEVAHDVFTVAPRGAAALADTASLLRRVESQLREMLAVNALHAGDATLLSDTHDLRAPPQAPQPLSVYCLDLPAAVALLAADDSPLALGEGAPRTVGDLYRTLLEARHPTLAAQLGLGSLAGWATSAAAAAGGGGPGAGARAARDWLLSLSELCLYLQREGVGQGEEGMVLLDLVPERPLGEGSTGTVQLARHRFSGRLYAVKSFSKAWLANGKRGRVLLRYIEREREHLQLLCAQLRGDPAAPLMVRYVCSGQDEHSLRIVMPAVLGGELWDLLANFGAMSDGEARFYVGCLVLALQKLHSIGIVYRDLKPENVLLSREGWPVIADFGLATTGAAENRPLFSLCGTPEFMAPEVVRSLGYGPSSDLWSLGVLLCQCLTAATPFADPDGRAQQTFSNVVQNRFTVPDVQHYRRACSSHAVHLIDSLLQHEPAKRLGDVKRDGGQSLRTHPFFWGLDWRALEARELQPPHADFCALRAERLLASPPPPPQEAAGDAAPLSREQQQLFAHW